ncbi:hypothetical protein [Rubinisphaera sp. JC750]|uniref:hypothetical protein n=1 Tax=Rubinisphaera sp. JC750 TaxID=2898658 RepID=UPI001F360019|nr:hypothetical protein [Rubinisphaera sp. JC750]
MSRDFRFGPFSGLLLVCTVLSAYSAAAADERPFGIQIIDEQTGRGVPLVELTTVNRVTFITDSAGWAAIDEPSLNGQRVFFSVKSHGYEFPTDGFGYRGKTLRVQPGETATLKIHRKNIAERLYRLTGAGIYQDSVSLGRDTPIEHPLLNAGVLGSDSVVSAVFKNRMYWFWGDTNLPQYPLGLFHVPGATTPLPSAAEVNVDRGLNFRYFTDEKGLARNSCEMPGKGPTWIDGLTVLEDDAGNERMFAHFAKVRPSMETYERGLVEFDDNTNRFRQVRKLQLDNPLHPLGHPVRVEEDGEDFIYFCSPFPYVRVPAAVESFLDPVQYEAFTCLVKNGESELPQVQRDMNGQPDYAWRKNGIPFDVKLTEALLNSGTLEEDDLVFSLRDSQSGKRIRVHNGSLSWNKYRKTWILIATELKGRSLLGEIWFAEATSPIGPWGKAVKVVTHDDYSFYNPKQHPEYAQKDGRIVYFEGTYTHTFSGNPVATPRYDYNQIMYRLNLDDPRLQRTSPQNED